MFNMLEEHRIIENKRSDYVTFAGIPIPIFTLRKTFYRQRDYPSATDKANAVATETQMIKIRVAHLGHVRGAALLGHDPFSERLLVESARTFEARLGQKELVIGLGMWACSVYGKR